MWQKVKQVCVTQHPTFLNQHRSDGMKDWFDGIWWNDPRNGLFRSSARESLEGWIRLIVYNPARPFLVDEKRNTWRDSWRYRFLFSHLS